MGQGESTCTAPTATSPLSVSAGRSSRGWYGGSSTAASAGVSPSSIFASHVGVYARPYADVGGAKR
jgi:hypothetical protein